MLFQPEELKDLMHVAIVNDLVSFVDLLLENGVSLKEFLTAERLSMLFNDEVDTYFGIFIAFIIFMCSEGRDENGKMDVWCEVTR